MKTKQFICNICENDFKNNRDLRGHIRFVHKEPQLIFKCNLCGKLFKQNGILETHIKYVHHTEEKFKCDF